MVRRGRRRRGAGRSGCTLAAVEGAPGQTSPAGPGPDLAHGRQVFDFWCAPCHAPGPGHPGAQSLQYKYGGDPPAAPQEREGLTPDAVKLFVRQGVMSMAGFRTTEITDAELDDLAAYQAQAHTEE